MTEIYRPGAWHTILVAEGGRTHAAAALAPEVSESTVLEIWQTLHEGGGFAGVLEALTSGYGVSLAALPPFAVLELGPHQARAVVRGPISAELVGVDGETIVVSGQEVTSWSERGGLRIRSATLRLDRPASPAAYPLVAGVVLASELAIGATADTQADRPVRTDPPSDPSMRPTAPGQGGSPAPIDEAADRHEDLEDLEATIFDAAEAEVATSADVESADMSAPAEDADDGYDALWGATVMKTVEDAAVRDDDTEADAADALAPSAPLPEPIDPPAAPASSVSSAVPSVPTMISGVPSAFGAPATGAASAGATGSAGAASLPEIDDHDGATVSLARLRGMQAGGMTPASTTPMAPQARVVLSTGAAEAIDGVVIVGRRPSARRAVAGIVPRLISVPSPAQDISRSHLELRLEGTTVLAIDLNTTNGTRLQRQGQDPVLLHPGEPTVVVAGDELDLGEGVVARIEETA